MLSVERYSPADTGTVFRARYPPMVTISSRLKFVITLVTGIIVPGVLDYLFSTAGLPQIGAVVWTVGYGIMIFILWYGWVRPIDFELIEPDTEAQPWETDEDQATSENAESTIEKDNQQTKSR